MSAFDMPYVTSLQAQGFDPQLASVVIPQFTVDVDNFVGTPNDMATALDVTSNFIMSNGTGGQRPFTYNTSAPAATVEVDGTGVSDAQLAQLLTDAAQYVRTAGPRVVGEPFVDVETAFRRITLGDFTTLGHRS